MLDIPLITKSSQIEAKYYFPFFLMYYFASQKMKKNFSHKYRFYVLNRKPISRTQVEKSEVLRTVRVFLFGEIPWGYGWREIT